MRCTSRWYPPGVTKGQWKTASTPASYAMVGRRRIYALLICVLTFSLAMVICGAQTMLKENKENEKKADGSATGSAAMETSSSKGHGGNIKEQPGSPDETPPTDELVEKNCKPGFDKQAKFFFHYCCKKETNLATMDDMLDSISLAERIFESS